jgi:hypothetical protein
MRIKSICPRGTSRVLLHAIKSYDMGSPDLFSTRKEGVLRIFIPLKNPLPWPGSNPQASGPAPSTLTTPPQRLATDMSGSQCSEDADCGLLGCDVM